MSTTTNKGTAGAFADSGGVVIKIDAGKGTKGLDVNKYLGKQSYNAKEHETILQHNTTLKITAVRDKGSSGLEVDAVVVSQGR